MVCDFCGAPADVCGTTRTESLTPEGKALIGEATAEARYAGCVACVKKYSREMADAYTARKNSLLVGSYLLELSLGRLPPPGKT